MMKFAKSTCYLGAMNFM